MAVSFVASSRAYAGAASVAVGKPSGVQAGDLLLAVVGNNFNVTPTIPGFTQQGSPTSTAIGGAGGMTQTVLTKSATGSEPSTYTVTATGASAVDVRVIALRNAGGVHKQASAVGLSAPSVTTTVAGCKVLSIWTESNGEIVTAPSPLVTRENADIGPRNTTVADVDQSTAGATGTRTGTYSLSPSTVVATTVAVTSSVSPNAPALTSPADGSTIDLSTTQRLAWAFSDPDDGDSQSKFDLQYWDLDGAGVRVGSAHTVTQSTPNQFYDVPAGTFTAGAKEWQVRTYDSLGLVGPYSSSGFFTTNASPADPTITAPVSGGTVNVSETLSWSAPNQDAYQVRRVADNAGTADPSTVYFDTGEVADATTRTLTVGFPDNNRWEHVQVRVKAGGLWSQWADVRVQVSWTPPAAPTVTLTPDVATASLTVAITNPAPGAGEPTVAYNDVYLSAAGVPEFRAATMVPANGSWTYWTPTSGLAYTVRVVAVATNGTTSETTAA